MSRPPTPPVPPPPPEVGSDLDWRWDSLLPRGAAALAAGSVMAVVVGSGDHWDRQIDQPMYTALAASLLGVLLVTRWHKLPLTSTLYFFMLVGAVWLLVKLGLLLSCNADPGVVQRELTESLMWLPALLSWSLLGGLNKATVWLLLHTMLLLLGLISLAGGLYWTWQHGWDPTVISGLLQLNLAGYVTYIGMQYFTQRVELLRFHEGERQALAQLAYRDLLTGLPNRLSLERELKQITAPAASGFPVSAPFALLFVDIDSFKVINDTMGHAAGDRTLQVVAQGLRAAVQEQGQTFRMSGDEFVVLLPGLESAAAQALAGQIQQEVTAASCEQMGVAVGLSIGVSFAPQDGTTPQELLRHADSAMYAVKRGGRGEVRLYQAEYDQQTERFQQIARALAQRHSPEQDGFYLLYQPIYDLRTGQLVKAETLLRWQHPELGTLSPEEFVTVAEQAGQMPRLGSWVLETACREALDWRPAVKVSVNVSAMQLARSDFPQVVADVLERTGLPSHRLELELTETAQLYTQQVEQNLPQLERLGVQLSIDDFGAGYANLSRLRSLSFSGIKLDRSLTQDLPSGDEFSHQVTESVVALAFYYSLDLTAEGLETPEHVQLAYEMGCPLGQGYALSPPVAASELRRLMRHPLRGHLPDGRWA